MSTRSDPTTPSVGEVGPEVPQRGVVGRDHDESVSKGPMTSNAGRCNVFGMKKELVIFAGAAGLLAARQYYRNWGTTKEESHAPMFGDKLIGSPATQTTAAEWIDAPVDVVWSRVLDLVLGKDRPNGADPAIGDVIRVPVKIFGHAMAGVTLSVVDVDGVDRRALVLRTVRPPMPVDVTCAWVAEPRWEDRARLIVRFRIALRHPGDFAIAEAAGPIVTMLTRRTLAAIRSSAVSGQEPRLVSAATMPR